ncbi:MAG: aldo/keto reductase [Verrucomicrobiota bacterium]|jgi:aryl-alcohol dehydrogenase-like predicted oxidoreductase
MKITRRAFTKKLGGFGVGGMLAFAGCDSRKEETILSEKRPDKQSTDGRTKLRRLGKTGLMLSTVGFGAQHTRDAELIRYTLDRGVNHIETAWLYGMGGQRSSCKCIGQAIAGRRDSVCLAVAYEAAAKPTSKAWLANQFEQTLRDLGTDHIDIFLWHHPGGGSINNSELTLKESQALVAAGQRVDLMLKWKNEGRFRWCGITTHSEQAEWLKFVVESKFYDVAVVAFNYKSPKAIAEAMQEASRKGIGLIAMKTQSPNYLNGEAGDAPDHWKALNWVLSKGYITAAIPGMTTRDQVDLNLGLMNTTA